MMAFFLLMWVLGSTTRGDLAGISAYFQNPLRVAVDGGAGSGDATRLIKGGGESMMHAQGQEAKADSDSTQRSKSTTVEQEADDEARKYQFDTKSKTPGSAKGEPDAVGSEMGKAQSDAQAAKQAAKQAAQAQQQMRAEIEQAVKADPSLSKIQNQLMMDVTSDGLRLQIVDEKNRPMFDSGATGLAEHTRRLMRIIGKVVGETNFAIKVEGHTDSKGSSSDSGRGNWELSADRANAARRELIAGGLRGDQVAQVVGYADKVRLNADDPNDPLNLRISITVLAKTAAGPKSKAPGTAAEGGMSSPTAPDQPLPGALMPSGSAGAPGASGMAPNGAPANGLAAPTRPDSTPPLQVRPEIKLEVLEAARRAGGLDFMNKSPLPAGARGKSDH
jgi:chemotaxis protein MotB